MVLTRGKPTLIIAFSRAKVHYRMHVAFDLNMKYYDEEKKNIIRTKKCTLTFCKAHRAVSDTLCVCNAIF